MNRTPAELILNIYSLLDDGAKRALRCTACSLLHMLPSPPTNLTVNMEDLEDLTDDIEAFRAVGGGRLITQGYAGITQLGFDGDCMEEVLDWDRISGAVLFVQAQEIAIYDFLVQMDGYWDRVTRLVSPKCRALTLMAVRNSSNADLPGSLMSQL